MMKVMFVAGFGPVVEDMEAAQKLYGETLGLPLEGDLTYLHSAEIDGVRHFAVWPLSGAAESCFGSLDWPAEVPKPHAWMEFDVEDIAAATAELEGKGYRPLVAVRTEPWGQVVTRFLGPDGTLVGLTVTPWMRE
jgi:catechol 2,3-dioxygenase-like lactoylglutathione lyase family enzyme